MKSNMKPIFYYDGSCALCCFWTTRWQRIVGDQVEFQSKEDLTSSLFVGLDKKESSGAEGVFRLLALDPEYSYWLRFYRRSRIVRFGSEILYRIISTCRICAWEVTRIIFPSARKKH